jgi:hypothetical protein
MLENKRQPSTAEDETPWLKRIAEIDVKQERLLDLHLERDITTEQFRAKRSELEVARAAQRRSNLRRARRDRTASKTSNRVGKS